MRRTYRSKKDTGGALDHRDVLQNMDEKSSAFDAFYIQNIKQTKRELSCVGPSNVYGVASKKVRKRKYVKRIVKEIENGPTMQPIESSTSTYLTPDKSIRVNKILDPFDMLLNSSSTGHIATDHKKDPLVERHMPKVGKTYTRKKLKKVKKINYSSNYSSDSDKENTSNTQPNITDIRTHELLVETEFNNNPKYLDESINKIVNNLSLIDNFKRKTANSSFNTSYKYHRNRLTKNCQSPILQKSPLCSTPFKDKYRGKSIYVFSPITSKERESPNYVTIAEENNESSNSIVFLCKEKVPKLSKKKLSPQTTWDDVAERDNSKSLIYDEIEHIQQETENEVETKTNTKNSDLVSEPSLFQITQAEPFLGFSGGITESVANDQSCYLKCIQEHSPENKLVNENDKNSLQISIDSVNINDSDKSDLRKCITPEKSNINNLDGSRKSLEENINLIESENYQIDKDESYKGENHYEKDNTIDHKDSPLENPNKKGNLNRSGDIIDDEDIKADENPEGSIVSNHSSNSYNSSHNSEDADNESMYDTCNSEPSLSEENNQKEPIVAIERMNDSIFIKYYEKMLINKEDSTSSSGSSWSNDVQSDESDTDENENESDDFDENLSKIDENVQDKNTIDESNTSFYNCSQSNTSNTSKNTESDSVETHPNEITITDSSTAEDIETYNEVNTNEEIHVSFVTTRRRNEITNDSMFIFDNSYGSSSTDCDKTVLSNEARLSCIDKSNSELDVKTDNNIIKPSKDKTVQECINGVNRITTRKSSRLTRQSLESTDIDSTINEVTMIGSGDNDEGSKVTGDKTSQFMKEELLKVNVHPDHPRYSVATRKSSRMFKDNSISHRSVSIDAELKPSIVLQPGKKWERSLSIYRRMTTMADEFDSSILDDEGQKKGRKYRQSVISTMEMQDSLHNESINSRRSTFVSKPSRPTIRFVKDPNNSRISLNTTEIFDDLKGFLNEECDDTVIELSKLSLADSEFEVTVLDNFDETSERIATARDYVLRRCNQTEPILFDECYPETVLKNCHKIGEGVYGEVFLWRGRDGRARVMKIVPIAGTVKVNGETQKDFHEVISEIVIAMELSALRAPIAEIDRYFDEGKDVELLELHAVENATDVFNEVLAVRCVQGPYPSRLLDLWELYDECKGSENDNPASLPADQQYIVLELANAGQDLESYQFTGAQQAHALFQQIAFGLAVGEESFQFEHRDLHWGNVLIAPTEQKFATFVLGGRAYRVPRGGVSATIIDYSLSRVTLPLAAEKAALYNDLATDEQLFEAVGDYQFQVYRLMRDKLGNDWKNFEPYTNILWLHYTVDKMITALRYKRTNTKIHKHYIEKLKGIKNRILAYKSATEYVLTDIEI